MNAIAPKPETVPLTRDQQRRKEAVKAARASLGGLGGGAPAAGDIIRVARYILTGQEGASQ